MLMFTIDIIILTFLDYIPFRYLVLPLPPPTGGLFGLSGGESVGLTAMSGCTFPICIICLSDVTVPACTVVEMCSYDYDICLYCVPVLTVVRCLMSS